MDVKRIFHVGMDCIQLTEDGIIADYYEELKDFKFCGKNSGNLLTSSAIISLSRNTINYEVS
jgi:hypothetical protein